MVPTSDELAQAGTNLLNFAWATDQPYRQINSSNEDSKLARASGPRGMRRVMLSPYMTR